MGGEREAVVSPSKSINKNTNIGDIRVHEKDGEIHFHADSMKLKVAVPVGVWFQAWMRLMDQGGSFSFVDSERGTSVTIAVIIDQDSIDANVTVDKTKVGDTFKALHEFTTRKS
jgi:hypothetical protein